MDRLMVWFNHIPRFTWLIYLLSVLVIAGLINSIFWVDGSTPVGTIDPGLTGFALFVVYWVGLYHYLTNVGTRSLRVFRPLLDVEDSEITRINYELSNLPRWIGLLAILLGFLLASAVTLGDPAPYGEIVPRTVLPYLGDILISGFMMSTFFCLVIRSMRQLRLVGRLHAQATHINLLKLEPAHAFSILTSRTGIGIIFVIIFSYPLDPTPLSSPLDITITGMTLLLAAAVFVLPINGIRVHLEEAKQHYLNETSDLLQKISVRLHGLIRDDDYQNVKGIKESMDALMRERELIQKTSTWPWDLSTLRGFATALLLPIVIWLVTRLLENILSL